MPARRHNGFVLITVLLISGLLATVVIEQAHELLLLKKVFNQRVITKR